MLRPDQAPEAARAANAYPGVPYTVTVNEQGAEQVRTVSTKARAGYLIARDGKEMLEEPNMATCKLTSPTW